MASRRIVAVIGAGHCDSETRERAYEVGRRLAEAGCIVATGGLGGVMEGASAGAAQAGGLVLGILPGDDSRQANAHVTVAVATGMGEARNAILVATAAGLIAVGGEYGTLSEIALALKAGKPLVTLDSWEVDESVERAGSPEAAVGWLLGKLG